MNTRPNTGPGIFANAHDMDQEGLVAFTAMAEEAMKIERMVVQQKELTAKLCHQLQKLCSKEEKEREKYSNLYKDVQSFYARNKLLKENLEGKRESRGMMEQMSADLERQMQLEHNSIQNKIQNMAKTEHFYTEMIKKYESVYLSSAEAKEIKRMQNIKSSIISEIKCIESSFEAIKQEYKQKMATKEQNRIKLVLKTAKLIGEHNKLQAKLQTSQALLQNLKEQVSKEQKEIEIFQKQASINNAAMEVTANKEMAKEATRNVHEKEKRKIKDTKIMLNFSTFTLPELQLPDLAIEPDDLMLQDNFDLGYSEFLQGINEINDRSEQMEEQQPETPLMQVDLPQTVEMNIEEESYNEPSQPVNQEIEMAAEEVVLNEPTTTEPTIPEPSNKEVAAQTMEQEGENEAVMAEQGEPHETPDQEEMQEGESASQVGSEESGAPAPGEPYYNSAMSQSSDGSSVDLLDDEKRRAYMMKLMASPQFSVEYNKQIQSETQSMSESSEYISPFLMTANSGRVMFGGQPQPTAPPQGSNVSNTTQGTTNSSVPFSMNSLFGESGDQEQTASDEQQAFSFGSFSFGASSSSAATNLFGSSSLFGSPTSQSAQNNPFGTSPSTTQTSEAFNLSFDKTNTPSIFKLF